MPDFSDPWMIAGLIAVVVAAGILLAGGKTKIEELLVSERKWCGEVAHYETAMGASAIVTAPWSDLASGDLPGFAAAMKAKITYLADAANREKEGVSIVKTLYATPTGKIAIDNLYADLSGGASDQKFADDAKGLDSAIPAGPGLGPLATQFGQLMHTVDSIHAGNTSVTDLAQMFSGNPATAPFAGFLTKLVSLGHDIGSAASTAAPVVAAVVPVTAPVAAVATGLQITGALAPGHVATVTNTTP